jgi:NADPH:quinone reductase-like Zn-dependent oxidoreductase
MYGTASSHKHKPLAPYGATLIDYKQDDFVTVIKLAESDGVDAVFDPIGQENWDRSSQVLKDGGILVGYGFTSILEEQQPSHETIEKIAEPIFMRKANQQLERLTCFSRRHKYVYSRGRGANGFILSHDSVL